jgi:hypothetical protein
MHKANIPPNRMQNCSASVQSALNFFESLIVEGVKHGFFDYSITCETGVNGRRLLIMKAGKSYKFSILESDIPE